MDSTLKLIALLPDLNDAIARSTDYTKHDRVTGTKDVGLVLNEHAMDVKTRILEWAYFVAGVVVSEGGSSGHPAGNNLDAVLRFIARHSAWLMEHDLAGDLVNDARSMLNALVAVTNPVRRANLTVPEEKCQTEVDGVKCGGSLIASLRDDDGTHAMFFFCQKDASHGLKTEQWIPVSRKLRNLHIPTNDAAKILETSIVHVHMIARRKGWKSFKSNRNRFYAWSDVERYLNERTR